MSDFILRSATENRIIIVFYRNCNSSTKKHFQCELPTKSPVNCALLPLLSAPSRMAGFDSKLASSAKEEAYKR